MKFLHNHYFIALFIFLYGIISAQEEKYSDYYKIQRQYENRSENDSTALPLVEKYIQKAKNEKSYEKLVQGYKDGLVFSSLPDDKLKYADSVICAAILTRDNDIISNAYLNKGVVYYFNFKKYKLALAEYLKAYEYCKDSNNQYHKNRLRYLIGVVKSYIGYYDEALPEFKQTSTFFESESKKKLHPNLIYGNRRGYYNSLHQMAYCYRKLDNVKSADSLIYIGLSATSVSSDYKQEHAYFLKERGISEFNREEYQKSIKTLENALKEINAVNDFASTTLCYFYIGKSHMQLGNIPRAILYFQKVDSVFQKHDFILPEVRNNYELLINYYKKQHNVDKELYYTNQLLRADQVIGRDFTYLSSKIHKEYDTRALQDEKERLERKSSWSGWMNIISVPLAVIAFIILYFRYRSEQKIRKNYKLLEQKILEKENRATMQLAIQPRLHHRLEIESTIVDAILIKLEEFEKNQQFLESGLNIHKVAVKFDTNRNYLSQIVNEYRGTNFNRYLSELRIGFITEKLYKDRKYLNYKIETLAVECGIASRSNFSNLFHEINGIRPADFIKQRMDDIEAKKDISDEVE